MFTDQDQQNTEPVVIIDETLAREYWPNENAIGKHIRRGSRARWSTIVGIVGHTKQSDLAGDVVKGKYYYPLFQAPIPMATFVVRSQSDPARLGTAIRDATLAVSTTLTLSHTT